MSEPSKFTYIRELSVGMKNVNCQFIVLDVALPRKTKDGHDVRNVRVADRSGSILMSVWDEIGACVQPSDICRLFNGYLTIHKNCLMLNVGRMGEMQKIGEFCMLFSELPYISSPTSEHLKIGEQQKPAVMQESIGDNDEPSHLGNVDLSVSGEKSKASQRN